MTSESPESPSQFDALAAVLSASDDAGGAQAVDECLAALAQLAQSEPAPPVFYATLLERSLAVIPAVGGAVWQLTSEGESRLIKQLRFPAPLIARQRPAVAASGQAANCQAYSIPAHTRASALTPCDNPFPWPLIVCPVAIDRLTLVIEFALLKETAPEVQAGATRLAGVIAEIAADFHRRRELVRLREREASTAKVSAMIGRMHARLDPAATAFTIANDGRQWIDCDRVSVLRLLRSKTVTLAVSAVDRVDRQSGQIVLLERLAAAVAQYGEPLQWQEHLAEELPPELANPLQAYLDASHARQLVVVPLRPAVEEPSSGERVAPLGLLVAESFGTQQQGAALLERAGELARLGAPALANACTHGDLPLLTLLTGLGRLLGTISRRPLASVLSVAALAAVIVFLVVFPADFTVEVEGTLQPLERRNLFAPSDGVVEEVLAEHGAQVTGGDVLLRMRSPALDLDASRLSGELQTAQARLAAVRSLRSGPDKSSAGSDQDRLASEELQLTEQIQGLENQLAVVEKWRGELAVTSPIEGVVLTWNAQQLLAGRPVKAGQLLLTVADAASPWVLELRLPDRQAGHVLAGQRLSQEKLPVALLLASDPAVTYRGQLARVGLASDASDGQSAAEATATLDSPLPSGVRAGTRVTARIDCGRRSIGYVWLHDVIDFVRTSLLF